MSPALLPVHDSFAVVRLPYVGLISYAYAVALLVIVLRPVACRGWILTARPCLASLPRPCGVACFLVYYITLSINQCQSFFIKKNQIFFNPCKPCIYRRLRCGACLFCGAILSYIMQNTDCFYIMRKHSGRTFPRLFSFRLNTGQIWRYTGIARPVPVCGRCLPSRCRPCLWI